ncbi:uncharacterized protein LOC127537286 [Acanthochromis polyacanthus]|uniref:uncharacterized protein LOC127537286 n=1 Tax=Acanthochromis polyacanthus TaxID=80966 RepID=UPI002234DF72|nr:uncharacterized protein LOC127537286 [Acanthochromis polyacanthus]
MAYEYQTLPFGLSLAPRVFSKCVEAALNPMRASGLRVFAYLDDFLLCAPNKENVEKDTRGLIDRLSSLGFSINPLKSCLSPTQKIEYLGLEIDSVSFRSFLSHARVEKFRQHLALFRRGSSVSLRDCLRLSGLMASSISVIPHGLLKMRDFLDILSASGRTTSPQAYGEDFPGVPPGSPSLERPGDIHYRRPIGSGCDEEDSYNRCLVNGVGSGFRGEVSERDLAPDASPGRASGSGCVGAPVAKRAAVCFPPSLPHHSNSDQSKGAAAFINPDSSLLAQQTVDGGADTAHTRPAMAVTVTRGPGVTGARAEFSSEPRTSSSLGLVRERVNLHESGLPTRVIETIQCARAPSTRSLYDNKWRVFEKWCETKVIIPFQCSVPDVLCFLQDLLDGNKAFSTIKVYLAAISACHVGFGGAPIGQHPLIKRFMKGVRRLRPVRKHPVPSWDLPLVLEALTRLPFEPLECADLRVLSLKTVLLLSLTSARRIGELQALSVHASCLQFSSDFGKVTLRPNPAFVPKVSDSAYSCSTLELLAFHPPPFAGEDERRLNLLCPVRALCIYMDRTKGFRKSNQLFISWAPSHKGRALTRQCLSHWVVEAIILAYESRGLQPPERLRAHSTRGMATSWALFKGTSVRDICAAASWASPHTFIRYYRLDVTETSLAHSVLSVGTS